MRLSVGFLQARLPE